MNQGFDDAVRLIREGQNFLLTCHVLPDADAVGSMLGLAEVLKRSARTWCSTTVTRCRTW